ncbi:MAG: hypothetical protein OQK51_24720 [Kangiellaceae bacterium]|nr:hypothetical protein [Kangiellaceae bacterium]
MQKYIIFILLLLSTHVTAETSTLTCNYRGFSDESGYQKVKERFELNFIIDSKTGKSYLLGNAGSSEVQFFKSNGQLSFVEMTATGNIMTTTVDDSLNSVHSRNTVVLGNLIPSQYYGKCIFK